MNTSSRVGRLTRIDWMGMPSSANNRGTNCSPPGTWNVTAPSLMVAVSPKCAARAAMAAALSAVCSSTRSWPTLAFRASGVSIRTISPLSMMAMRSQFSASSM